MSDKNPSPNTVPIQEEVTAYPSPREPAEDQRKHRLFFVMGCVSILTGLLFCGALARLFWVVCLSGIKLFSGNENDGVKAAPELDVAVLWFCVFGISTFVLAIPGMFEAKYAKIPSVIGFCLLSLAVPSLIVSSVFFDPHILFYILLYPFTLI